MRAPNSASNAAGCRPATNEESGDVALPEVATDYSGVGGGRTFGQWMQIGLALTLPLIIFGFLACSFSFGWRENSVIPHATPTFQARHAA